ncbi:MAG: hypothetical protein LW825_02785 [Candidatus Jidaibacter sp.]|nr:hypothetical protein [Candidatus Jidaibacter sp.]
MRDIATILYHFWQARKLMQRFKTREQLEQWQEQRLSHFKRAILNQSPFYREYCDKPLEVFPAINKKIMLEHFDAINTKGIALSQALEISRLAEESRNFAPTINDITVGLSSGTSGKQSIFLASKAERLKWAGIMLAKALPGSITEPHKIAFFLRANSNLYTTLSKGRHIQFHFFDLTQDFETNLASLKELQPSILTVPASVLKQIAMAQELGKIRIKPRKIFSVAEVLDSEDQSYIEAVFKQNVHQIYQCTEGFLGITNQTGKLYLNEEYIHIEKEWVDKESGRFVPIITDFSRTTQPIVRYRLDDILVEDVSDTSPFTCLKSIEGRCDDVCYFPLQDGKLKPVFADIVRQAMIRAQASFREYKIIQHAPQKLEIQLLAEDITSCKQEVTASIHRLCKQRGCVTPEIYFSSYIASPPHQKLRRIERRFALPHMEAA